MRGPKGAVPTTRGWVNPKTGELLKSQKISETDVQAWHGEPAPVKRVVEQVQPAPKMQMLNEAPTAEKPLETMTKVELEALGRTMGIELDRRKAKEVLIDEIKEVQEVVDMYN